MTHKLMTALTAMLLFAATANAQPGYMPSQDNLEARKEFQDSRFGIFIHWGTYSMLGHGEWVMHNEGIDHNEYARLAGGFCPSGFSAEKWVEAFRNAGAGYVCFTSRHHDGFSMFGSKASSYNIVEASPFGRDVVGELAEACREQDMKLHLYYSHLDWGRSDYYPLGRTGHGTGRTEKGEWSDYIAFMETQLTELLTNYGPIGAIWFDGFWDRDEEEGGLEPSRWNLYEQYELIHRLQPACLIGNNHHMTPFLGEDIQIFERDVPGANTYGLSGQEVSMLPLETCQTMNRSWGYRITDTYYKSAEELIRYLVSTAGRDANLLLNIGPRPDGTLPEEALTRLEAMGKWLKANGESIYGTRAGLVKPQGWGVVTHKDSRMFAHVLERQGDSIFIPTVKGKQASRVLSAKRFSNAEKLPFRQTPEGIIVTLPHECDPVDEIIELTFKENL